MTAALSDNITTIGAARHCYGLLLRRGAKIYEYRAAKLHMKLIVADDVVFAEVGAGLHFNEHNWRSAVVANSVFGVNGDFDCAASGHGVIDIVKGDDGSAFDDDPVFRPLVV